MDKEIVHAVLDKMGDMLNIKVIAGAVLGLVTHKYSILMIGFGVLLYLDILTKWIAISYAYLVEQGNENSTEMRTRGVSKLFVYCICFLMAAIFDLMSMAAGGSSQIVQIVCGYLAMNEALSIIENLGDAGVKSMARLYELLQRRGK